MGLVTVCCEYGVLAEHRRGLVVWKYVRQQQCGCSALDGHLLLSS